jgi:TolC family type I secretion outer membrane protein
MLSTNNQVKNIIMNKRVEPMRNQYAIAPWGLRLGVLGLALSVSPLFMEAALAKRKPAAKTSPVPAKVAVEPAGYPLDKAAAARKPEERGLVNTLEAALEAAYRNNPELKELQATLRSKDEGVPQALAGWRPTVTMNASVGGEKNIVSGTQKNGELGSSANSGSNASTASADVTLQQNLFRGGETVAKTCQAESLVQTARAQLADKEREVLFAAVQAYFTVIAKTSELEYRRSNELALKKTLEATQDKFKVGEETRTSIAQNEANLAEGVAQRELAEAQLLAAEATFEQVTGTRPGKLKEPGALVNLPGGLKEALEIAKKSHPAIVAALHQEKADRSAIKISDAELLPTVDLTGKIARSSTNSNTKTRPFHTPISDFKTAQQVAVNLKVPLYEGGAIRGRSRGLREVAEQRRINIETVRRKVTQQLVEAWETYVSAKANVHSYQTQVKANEVSLEGTRQEMLVGSKILLDVLNAQRDLVTSQLNLVRAKKSYYESAYNILALMGRLNVLDMKLKVKRYDPQVHYHDVRNSW